MRKFSKGEEEAEVNMTPLLDIVFIMLIFFIVTASFVKEQGLQVTKPEDNQTDDNPPPDPDKRPISFIIDSANRIKHEFRTIDLSSVSSIIKRGSVERPDVPVIIMAADGSETGTVIRIYDEARKVGFRNDKIIVTKKK